LLDPKIHEIFRDPRHGRDVREATVALFEMAMCFIVGEKPKEIVR
jgi:hypothetical protein